MKLIINKDSKIRSTPHSIPSPEELERQFAESLLRLLASGGPELAARLFGGIIDLPANELQTRAEKGGGLVACNCNYQIKIVCKLRPDDNQSDEVNDLMKWASPADGRHVVFITPDEHKPQSIAQTAGRMAWMNLNTMLGCIAGCEAITAAAGYQEAFMAFTTFITTVLATALGDLISTGVKQGIKALNELFKKHKTAKKPAEPAAKPAESITINNSGTVIIVGGDWNERIAKQYGFYTCQPNRAFREAKYMAFCCDDRIQEVFEIVKPPVECVDIQTSEDVPQEYFPEEEPCYEARQRKLFLLQHIFTFRRPILNDLTDENGNPRPFPQGQTYTTFNKIMCATKTSEL